MAAFKTHLAGGVFSGVAVACAGHLTLDLNIYQTLSVVIMGSLGGILPDIDSDSGKPLTLLFGMISVIIPVLLLIRITNLKDVSPEFLVSYFVGGYLIINYLICSIIKKITIHRGIMHSIPFAVLFGEAVYLFFIGSGKEMATITAISVFAGCITHLILDEIHSVSFSGIIPRLKKSSGTALKLASGNMFVNLLVYCLIFVIYYSFISVST